MTHNTREEIEEILYAPNLNITQGEYRTFIDEVVPKIISTLDHQLQKAYEQGSLDGYKNGLRTAVDMGQCKFPTNGITDKTELQKAREEAYSEGWKVGFSEGGGQERYGEIPEHSELDQDNK